MKKWRDAGFGATEIVFGIALLGYISGIAIYQPSLLAWPGLFPPWDSPTLKRALIECAGWSALISIPFLVVTAPACLAGWLGKIVFPKWAAPAVRRAKGWGACVGVGLLAVIMIPNFLHPHTYLSPNACVNNLRLIDSAKQQWALNNGKGMSAIPAASDIQPYLGRGAAGALPYCPVDSTESFTTSYSINNMATKPTCKLCPSIHVLP